MPSYRPKAIIFDVTETLFDLESLRAPFADAGLPALALEAWLARVRRDGFAHAAAGTFAAFPDLAAYHLRELVPGRAEEAAAHVARILEALRTVPPHPDVVPGLARLHHADVHLATLTNATVELSSRWLEQSGLRTYFARVLDASEAMLWRPRREPYVRAAKQLGVEPELCAFVSVHPWDIHGAMCAGLMGAWLDRRGTPYPETMNAPTTQARTLDELADRLLARPQW
jgi:2-haloacid dehalogenase